MTQNEAPIAQPPNRYGLGAKTGTISPSVAGTEEPDGGGTVTARQGGDGCFVTLGNHVMRILVAPLSANR